MQPSADDLLGDSLFQVNLILWMLQPQSGSTIRPLLAEAGYKLRALEPTLPLSPALIARLATAAVAVKENAAPDVILANNLADHLIVECKARMFGSTPSPDGGDSNQRQARAFLLQAPDVLGSALAGARVNSSHLAYLTRHDDRHDQAAGLHGLARELAASKLPVVDCCVFRLIAQDGAICLVAPKRGERWPTRIRSVCKPSRGGRTVTVVPRDEGGNDLRPLYFIPWMPDSEPATNEYNRRAFGNRILGAAVSRVGRTALGEDLVLDLDDLLNEVALGIFGRWQNKEATKAVRMSARKLLFEHLKQAHAIAFDPDRLGHSLVVKVSDEKTQAAIIKAFRETITTEWDRPDPQGVLPFSGSTGAE